MTAGTTLNLYYEFSSRTTRGNITGFDGCVLRCTGRGCKMELRSSRTRTWDEKKREERREGPPCLHSRQQVKAEWPAMKNAIPTRGQHPEHKRLNPSPGCSNTDDITHLPLPDARPLPNVLQGQPNWTP